MTHWGKLLQTLTPHPSVTPSLSSSADLAPRRVHYGLTGARVGTPEMYSICGVGGNKVKSSTLRNAELPTVTIYMESRMSASTPLAKYENAMMSPEGMR